MGGRSWFGVIAACWAVGGACGGVATEGQGDAGGNGGGGGLGAGGACVPRETTACRGPSGCNGTHTCLPDGSAFGLCQCSIDSSGGSAGTFGTGGAGGSIVLDGGSGTDGFAGGACAAMSYEAQWLPRAVQIVWAVDNSSSMTTEVSVVENELNAFVDTLTAIGIDVRVVLVTSGDVCIPAPLGSGACPNDANPERYLHVVAPISGGDALSRLIEFYPQYKSMLELTRQTYVGVISDANASMSAAQFSSALTALDPIFTNWRFSGIVCGRTCEPACSGPASVYQTLVTERGGFVGDLCDPQAAFLEIADGLSEIWRIPCVLDLPSPPGGEELDPTLINIVYTMPSSPLVNVPRVRSAAECGTDEGWYYDDPASPTQILLCPTTCSIVQSTVQAELQIQFGCGDPVLPY